MATRNLMLRSLRILDRRRGIPLTHFSSLAQDSESLKYSESELITNEDALQFKRYLKSHFYSEPGRNVQHLRTGTYVPLTSEDLDTCLPEGIPGTVAKEFENTAKKMWMVRDSTKLLCRYIDESEKRLTRNVPSQASESETTQNPESNAVINIPKLTDRGEWESSQLKCFHYGKRLDVDVGNGESKLDVSESVLNKLLEPGSNFPDKLVLTGERGVGKSILINQAVIHARKRGWLCLFVSDGWGQVHSGAFIDPLFTGEEGLYDNSFMTKTVLRAFLKAHRNDLSQRQLKNTEKAAKYAPFFQKFMEDWKRAKLTNKKVSDDDFMTVRSIVQGLDNNVAEDGLDKPFLKDFKFENFQMKTLEDLILVGLVFYQCSGVVFKDLMEEIMLIDDVPVLVAVDGYNSWFGDSSFMYEGKVIHSNQLIVPHLLQVISSRKTRTNNWKLKNGIAMTALSFTHPEDHKHTTGYYNASLPLAVNVGNYTQLEYLSAFSYYMNYSMIEANFRYDDFILYRMYTNSNPHLMFRDMSYFFLPKIFQAAHKSLESAFLQAATARKSAGITTEGLSDADLVSQRESLKKKTEIAKN